MALILDFIYSAHSVFSSNVEGNYTIYKRFTVLSLRNITWTHSSQTNENKNYNVHLRKCPLFALLPTSISSFPSLPASRIPNASPSSFSCSYPLLSLPLCLLALKADWLFHQGHLMKMYIKVECSCQLTTVPFKNCWVLCVWEFQCPLPLSDWFIQRNTFHVAFVLPRAEVRGRIIVFSSCFLRYILSLWLKLLTLQDLILPLVMEWGWHPLFISECGIKIHEDQYRFVTGSFTS